MSYSHYNRVALRAELSRDEGREPMMYLDSEGIETIGVGWNLKHNPLPEDVIDRLLDEGIEQAEEALDKIEPRWRDTSKVTQARQRALLNLAFNLGQTRLAGFKKMWESIGNAITTGNASWWDEAAKHALDSKWATQVGPRAQRIAAMFRTGNPA